MLQPKGLARVVFAQFVVTCGPSGLALKLARGALARAQVEATDLLMAYGHGVRARLGQRGERGAGDQRVVVRRRKAR